MDDRIATIKAAIDDAQASANNETKSTAGDKHDTSRAMMQLEVEQKSKQLSETLKLKETLGKFSDQNTSAIVGLGSVVETSAANYYISISAGKLNAGGSDYFAVSGASPIGQLLLGKKAGDIAQFNGKKIEISAVY
ncbi:3-oxoacyl-ACP synthase [Paracrocinitomix mangrovi]|uniref:3-oxoacyl-ACP synthase n=1 Tax=Paracrocinitomix mangrovi TaxID=2862509 RepID=UPI001EDA3A31|nr:3-oxoacyl-ACP synthase [Paracrocinitomix mangrovi]UKN03023.1 3-oxoacyl-ACP synthase [Paracrocinitomix mangrovi]